MKVYLHFAVVGFSNAYLVGPENGGDAILIDPGTMETGLLELIEKNRYYIRHVLATHTHDNHIRGIKTLKKIYDTTLYGKTSRIFEHPCTRVHDGDMLDCSGIPVEVIEIPGHSVDSVVYRIDRYLFTGDVLYAGKVGSALSSYARVNLISSIRNKLLVYDDDSVVFPGHGPPSTIGAERRFNIALRD